MVIIPQAIWEFRLPEDQILGMNVSPPAHGFARYGPLRVNPVQNKSVHDVPRGGPLFFVEMGTFLLWMVAIG